MTYQESLGSFMWLKLCRECPGLLEPRVLTPTDADLIFVKAKPKAERHLQFSHFLDALSAVAERKYPECAPADGLRLLLEHHLAPLYGEEAGKGIETAWGVSFLGVSLYFFPLRFICSPPSSTFVHYSSPRDRAERDGQDGGDGGAPARYLQEAVRRAQLHGRVRTTVSGSFVAPVVIQGIDQ